MNESNDIEDIDRWEGKAAFKMKEQQKLLKLHVGIGYKATEIWKTNIGDNVVSFWSGKSK